MNMSTLWPACLPRQNEAEYLPDNRGILSGWADPQPTYLTYSANLQNYAADFYLARE
jgi:hypothetical protein